MGTKTSVAEAFSSSAASRRSSGSRPRVRSIVFLTYHFPPEVGGIQTRISKYVERLSERGIRVSVLVAGHNPSAGLTSGGVEVTAIRGGLKRLPVNALEVTRQVAGSRADVVHVFTGSSTLLGVYALALARFLRARAVISLFGREDFVFRSMPPRVFLRLSTSMANSIDVNSDATGSMLPGDVRHKVHVLLGAAEESDEADLAVRGEPVVLFVGRLVQRKGVDDLLRALAVVKVRFPTAKLSIVGDGPEMRSLVELAHSLNLDDAVEFKGVLRGAPLAREYASCTVFVLPSKYVPSDPASEGLGLALIEASMHAKPIIGTIHGGIPEVVDSGRNGLLVPPGDSESLAQALVELLSDPGKAEEMGRAALEMARARFGWDRATDVLLESYSS
ncbi:MAG: glycosyltransferase family 4 protein [Nitrososphaerales archaeon]|jgi:glycosyltransferase involved in cell wall biosynthesis